MNNNYKKAIPIYLLLILIPIVFSLLLYFFILDIEKKQKINEIKSHLSEKATDFIAKTTPVDYFETYFNAFTDKICQKNTSKINNSNLTDKISQAIKDLRKKLNENIRCVLFDDNYNILNPNDILDYEARFFTFAWKEIHNIPRADYKGRRSDQALIMGWEFNSDKMREENTACIPTESLGKSGVFFFRKAKKSQYGIIIFVEYTKSNLDFVRAKVKDHSSSNFPIILYDLKNQKTITNLDEENTIPFEKNNTEEFLNGFIEKNIIWHGINSDEYKILFGQRLADSNRYEKKLYTAIVIFLFILSVATLLFFKNFTGKNGLFISIRYKLILIFALAIYIPSISLWVLSYGSLQDHRITIENSVKKGMLDILNKIDSDYQNEEEDIRKCFHELDSYLKSFNGKEPPTKREINLQLLKITGPKRDRSDRFNWLDIRHINQSIIFTTSNKESRERLEQIGRIISLLCLEKYCPERLAYAGIKLSQSDLIVGNLLENPISGIAAMLERPNDFVRMNFDGSGGIWWWNYYKEKDNPIAFCIGNTNHRHTTSAYFKSIMNKRYNLNNVNLGLILFQYSAQEMFPPSYMKKNPKDFLTLIDISNANKSVESATIKYDGNDYICICIPGSHLKECFILCMYPISKIDYQINKIRSDIYTLMIILTLVSILTGLLLAKNFIVPIKELNRGLKALRERNTNTNISIENRDELGKLGQAFNQMVSDIKDMLLAGAVQRCIIPVGKYEIEGYDCLIYNQMATDVGGDYADIFELPNDRLLIVIGDVTGHGVSSSLITTMVKASVFRFAKKDTPLNEIVTNTSNMICDLLNKKKLMTFCAITLDKKTGDLSVCNAGHPYPIIREEKAGKIRTPCKTSIPMGISKKRGRYTSEAEKINNGETLFIYTDGFPEAENEKGEEYTYERFQQLISDIEITDIEKMKDDLLAVFKHHHGEKELADDISFIILRRKPLQHD